MRSKKEFFADMCEKSKARMKELREADEKLKDIEKKRELKIYAEDALNNMSRDIRRSKERILADGKEEMKKLCSEYIDELHDAQGLDGSEIDDSIMKVLDAPIELTTQDIKTLLNKCGNNATMARIVLRYAKEHGIECGMMFVDPQQKIIDAVESLPYTFEVAEKWYNRENVYDELLGDNSDYSRFFNN